MKTNRAAFSLIEVMVVMVIIAVIAGIILGAAGYVQRTGAVNATRAMIVTIEAALESYKIDKGEYPATLTVTTLCPASGKQYMTFRPQDVNAAGQIVDTFGTPYHYSPPNTPKMHNIAMFDLWSYGPDRQPNTGDEITNWN